MLASLEVVGGTIFKLPSFLHAIHLYTPHIERLAFIPRITSSASPGNEALCIDLSCLRSLSSLHLSIGLFLAMYRVDLPPRMEEIVLFEWRPTSYGIVDGGSWERASVVKKLKDIIPRAGNYKRLCVHSSNPEDYGARIEELHGECRDLGKQMEFVFYDTRMSYFLHPHRDVLNTNTCS